MAAAKGKAAGNLPPVAFGYPDMERKESWERSHGADGRSRASTFTLVRWRSSIELHPVPGHWHQIFGKTCVSWRAATMAGTEPADMPRGSMRPPTEAALISAAAACVDRRLSGLRTPFFASSMILLATASWATSGRLVYLRAADVISNATLMTRLASGSNLKPSKNLVMCMIRSRLQAGARWVSQPPAPGESSPRWAGPLSVMKPAYA